MKNETRISSVDSLLDISGDYISRGEVMFHYFDEEIVNVIDLVLFKASCHIEDAYPDAYEILHDMWLGPELK